MKRRLLAVCGIVCVVLSSSIGFAGIDEPFIKPKTEKTWGELLAELFSSSEYNYRKSYALIIGISDFDDFVDLPTAKDPIRVKDYLINEAGFDYVHVLTEEKVTELRIRELMQDKFSELIKYDDRFIFYWSGHGHTRLDNFNRPLGFLPTSAAKRNQLSRMISMGRLAEWDSLIKAKQVLYLIDSCFSGHAGVRPQNDVRHVTIAQMAQPSRHILTAGTADQETIATEKLQGSIFTHAVLEGLRGDADTQSAFERDGLVTMNELEDYVKKRVEILRREAHWQSKITPQLWDFGQNDGEFFFVSVGHKKKRLTNLDGTFSGKFEHGRAIAMSGGEPVNVTEQHSELLREVQVILAALGYDPGPSNGVLGLRTRGAIRRFQSDQNLSATDGELDVATLSALEHAWGNRKNSSDLPTPEDVKNENILNQLPTGIFGIESGQADPFADSEPNPLIILNPFEQDSVTGGPLGIYPANDIDVSSLPDKGYVAITTQDPADLEKIARYEGNVCIDSSISLGVSKNSINKKFGRNHIFYNVQTYGEVWRVIDEDDFCEVFIIHALIFKLIVREYSFGRKFGFTFLE